MVGPAFNLERRVSRLESWDSGRESGASIRQEQVSVLFFHDLVPYCAFSRA
jgi:hypothetical protein